MAPSKYEPKEHSSEGKAIRHASQAQPSLMNDLKLAVFVKGWSFIRETSHPEVSWSGLQSLIVELVMMNPKREPQRHKIGKDLPESSECLTVHTIWPDLLHLEAFLRLGLLLGDPLLLEEDVASIEDLAVAALIGSGFAAEALQL